VTEITLNQALNYINGTNSGTLTTNDSSETLSISANLNNTGTISGRAQ